MVPERRMVEEISEKVFKVNEREVLILLLKVGKYSFKKLFLSPQWVQVKFSYTLTSSLILSLDCM